MFLENYFADFSIEIGNFVSKKVQKSPEMSDLMFYSIEKLEDCVKFFIIIGFNV